MKIKSISNDFVLSLFLFIITLGIWVLGSFYIDKNIISQSINVSNEEARGLFGDKFGAINALFSGLAFAGIIFTIVLQRKELSLQRKELEDTRNVLKNQNETLELQRFENTFFNLLKLQRETFDGISITVAGTTYTKSQVFERKWLEFKELIRKSGDNTIENCAHIFNEFIIKNDKIIGTYLSNILNTLRFISRYDFENLDSYINIYRAQFTSLEKNFLLYAGAIGAENNQFKPLLERFHMLYLFDESSLIDPSHWRIFSDSAFSN